MDPFKELDDKIKFYLTEILTLKTIREAQYKTITDLQNENGQLRKQLEELKARDKK